MSRPIPAALKAELEGSPFSGLCLALLAVSGSEAGFTTLDIGHELDLSADGGPALSCAEGMVVSQLTLACGLDTSFAEVSGALDAQLTEAQVNGGKWDDAEAWLVDVSPNVPGEYAPLLRGKVREARTEERRWVLEIRNQADALNQVLGKVLTPLCDVKEFGDTRCGFNLVALAATVTGVTDAMRFQVTYAGDLADDHFNLGRADFLTGELAGVRSDAIFDFTRLGAGAGSLVLRTPLWQPPEVGDTLELRQGCPRTREACIHFHGDARPFRGFPDMEGTEQRSKYPNPGGNS